MRYGIIALLVITGTVGLAGSPAGAQKYIQDTRWHSENWDIADWSQYAANGTPVGRDPNCTNYAGVHRWSKVYADVYAPPGDPLHAAFRMEFHSTYDTAVANAATAIILTQHRFPTCNELKQYEGAGNVNALYATSCGAASVYEPMGEWCGLVANHPNDPAIDMHMNETCRQPTYGGNWGLPYWHSWHNLDALFYTVKYSIPVLGTVSVPVYLDDVDFIGGVSNYDQGTGEPSFGSQWIGYGRVQSPIDSIWNVAIYDAAARDLGLDPIAHPADAHIAVQNKIDNNGTIPNIGRAGTWYKGVLKTFCTNTAFDSFKVADLLDGNQTATLAGFQQDLSGWVQTETGSTLCQVFQKTLPNYAPVACHFGVATSVIASIDNKTCMNIPDNPIAVAFNQNLGCTRNSHIIAFFTKLKQLLGG
jgi:hypothetical protein